MIKGTGAHPERVPIRLIGLSVLVLLLMSYPWLAPALQQQYVFGLPLVLAYFFVLWGLCILLAALMRAEP